LALLEKKGSWGGGTLFGNVGGSLWTGRKRALPPWEITTTGGRPWKDLKQQQKNRGLPGRLPGPGESYAGEKGDFRKNFRRSIKVELCLKKVLLRKTKTFI